MEVKWLAIKCQGQVIGVLEVMVEAMKFELKNKGETLQYITVVYMIYKSIIYYCPTCKYNLIWWIHGGRSRKSEQL